MISLGVATDQERALAMLQTEPYVRRAAIEGGGLRLYVDRGEVAMPSVLRLLDGAGFELQTIALSRPSLDDVFLQQTGHSLREPESGRAA